jgi:NAD(P)H-hydrate repair Nnr-like enzyme with NAD(P)H-hydrate epimerase domain
VVKLVSVAEMQAIEREANQAGLTYDLMMEHAGAGLAEVVVEIRLQSSIAWPDRFWE